MSKKITNPQTKPQSIPVKNPQIQPIRRDLPSIPLIKKIVQKKKEWHNSLHDNK